MHGFLPCLQSVTSFRRILNLGLEGVPFGIRVEDASLWIFHLSSSLQGQRFMAL